MLFDVDESLVGWRILRCWNVGIHLIIWLIFWNSTSTRVYVTLLNDWVHLERSELGLDSWFVSMECDLWFEMSHHDLEWFWICWSWFLMSLNLFASSWFHLIARLDWVVGKVGIYDPAEIYVLFESCPVDPLNWKLLTLLGWFLFPWMIFNDVLKSAWSKRVVIVHYMRFVIIHAFGICSLEDNMR